MATQRRTHTDLAAVKRSRRNFVGAITRARDKFIGMQDLNAEDINIRTIEQILSSLTVTETGFFGTLEDAQTFIADEEAQEDLQTEEDEANDSFLSAMSEARDMGEGLLTLKHLRRSLDDFKIDLAALQDLVDDQPEHSHSNALQALEETHSTLRKEWKKTDLSPDHSLKAEIDTSKRLLTKLSSDVATQRETRDTASSHSSSSSDSVRPPRELETKLPTIDVPTFHGDIMKWSTFWSAFQATIDSRNLSKTNKLTYLRKAIRDPDSQTLLHSPQETPDFYDEVVKALKTRFDRTKEIHRNLVQSVVSLPAVKNTRTELRKRVDDLKHVISSIQHTGHYDLPAVLTSMVYHTLPMKLQTLWDQHTKKVKGVAPIDELLAFLTDHAETLPASQSPPTPTSGATPPHHKKNAYKGERKPKPGIHAVTPVAATHPQPSSSYRWECIFCKPEKHPLFLCPKWLGFSISQRLSQVQSRKLCKNCLSVGHSTESCRSTYRCRECNSSHHTTLHQAAAPPTAPPTATPTTAASVSVNSATAKIQSSILMTAQVLLTGPRGQKVQARAFIDPGAAMSLISSKVAQQLHLPLEKTHLQFSAVLAIPCKAVKHLTNLSVSSLQGEHPVSVRAAVVTTVTGDIPAQETEPVNDLPHLSGLGLADPTFHLPGKVDILLGSEVYPQLMMQEPMITGNSSEPAALQTIFGWAIIGPVRSKDSHSQQISTQCSQTITTNEDLDTLLSFFWNSEEPERPVFTLTQMEIQVQLHYADTFSYCPSKCRYQVSLPWKPDVL